MWDPLHLDPGQTSWESLLSFFLTWEWGELKRPPEAVVQLPSCVWLFGIPWTATCQTSLSLTISRSLPKFTAIESVMPCGHFIFCHPLLILHSIFPSIRVFSNELALCIGWLKYWSFRFSISPSNEHSGWISFSTDWFEVGILTVILLCFLSDSVCLYAMWLCFSVACSDVLLLFGHSVMSNSSELPGL